MDLPVTGSPALLLLPVPLRLTGLKSKNTLKYTSCFLQSDLKVVTEPRSAEKDAHFLIDFYTVRV